MREKKTTRTKTKGKSEKADKLADANKKLRAQVRQLRKQLKQLEADFMLLHELQESELLKEMKKQRREAIKEKRIPLCPECGNPTLDVATIGCWVIERCSSCDYFNRETK